MDLKERISTARKAKNWTQMELASALKVNVKNVSRWELGSSAPSFEAATQLAKVLNVSLDFLAGLENSSQNNELTALFISKVGSMAKEQQSALKTILNAF